MDSGQSAAAHNGPDATHLPTKEGVAPTSRPTGSPEIASARPEGHPSCPTKAETKTVSVAASPTGSAGPGAFLGPGAGAQAPGSSSAAYIVHRARQVGATPRAEVGKASPSLWGCQVQLSSLSHAGAHTQDFPGPGGSAWIQGWDGGDQGLRSSQGPQQDLPGHLSKKIWRAGKDRVSLVSWGPQKLPAGVRRHRGLQGL